MDLENWVYDVANYIADKEFTQTELDAKFKEYGSLQNFPEYKEIENFAHKLNELTNYDEDINIICQNAVNVLWTGRDPYEVSKEYLWAFPAMAKLQSITTPQFRKAIQEMGGAFNNG